MNISFLKWGEYIFYYAGWIYLSLSGVNISFIMWSSWLGLQNTLTAFLQKSKTPSPNEYPGFDTKQSDGEAPVMLELWRMQSTSLLPSLPDPIWPQVVAPDRVLSMALIKLNSVLMQKWIVWNRTVYMYKNGFGIKYPTMVDISSNQTKLSLWIGGWIYLSLWSWIYLFLWGGNISFLMELHICFLIGVHITSKERWRIYK